jgi:hypothetical protein
VHRGVQGNELYGVPIAKTVFERGQTIDGLAPWADDGQQGVCQVVPILSLASGTILLREPR